MTLEKGQKCRVYEQPYTETGQSESVTLVSPVNEDYDEAWINGELIAVETWKVRFSDGEIATRILRRSS